MAICLTQLIHVEIGWNRREAIDPLHGNVGSQQTYTGLLDDRVSIPHCLESLPKRQDHFQLPPLPTSEDPLCPSKQEMYSRSAMVVFNLPAPILSTPHPISYHLVFFIPSNTKILHKVYPSLQPSPYPQPHHLTM